MAMAKDRCHNRSHQPSTKRQSSDQCAWLERHDVCYRASLTDRAHDPLVLPHSRAERPGPLKETVTGPDLSQHQIVIVEGDNASEKDPAATEHNSNRDIFQSCALQLSRNSHSQPWTQFVVHTFRCSDPLPHAALMRGYSR